MSITLARTTIPLSPPQAVPATTGLVFNSAQRDATGSATVVLAHGAGSGPGSDVLHAVGERLAAHGHRALSFAFAYREAGRRVPDSPRRLLSAWADAVAWVEREFGDDRPLVLGGRSMGGRIASMLVAEGQPCAGLVLLAYPLHPALRSGWRDEPRDAPPLRTEHWPSLHVPTLFVQGDRDVRADLGLLDQARAGSLSEASTVHVLRGADHGFGVRKRDRRTREEIVEEVAATVAAWVDERTRG